MEFRHIEAFVNVVKHKSFSKAADASFVTQPTISVHISSLEKELGVQLLERTGKEVLPTSQGQQFYKYALNMLNIRSKAAQAAMDMQKEPVGIVELQSSTVPAQVFLPEIIADFSKKHDKIKFYIEQSDSVNALENLAARRGELAFVGNKTDATNMIYEEIFEDEDVLITPCCERFSKMSQSTLCVEDFISEPFVLRETGSGTVKKFEAEMQKKGYSGKALNVIARTNSSAAIINTVAAGAGVSIISKKTAELNSGNNRLKIFSIEGFSKKRKFYMVYGKNTVLSPAADAFKSFITQSIAPPAPDAE